MPIFHKRHHEAIAKVMAEVNRDKGRHALKVPPIKYDYVMDQVINKLCIEFKADNDEFDWVRFMAACVE